MAARLCEPLLSILSLLLAVGAGAALNAVQDGGFESLGGMGQGYCNALVRAGDCSASLLQSSS